MNEALKKDEKYRKKYMKNHRMLCLLLDNAKDKDIISWLDNQTNRSEAVRNALRTCIEYQEAEKNV